MADIESIEIEVNKRSGLRVYRISTTGFSIYTSDEHKIGKFVLWDDLYVFKPASLLPQIAPRIKTVLTPALLEDTVTVLTLLNQYHRIKNT